MNNYIFKNVFSSYSRIFFRISVNQKLLTRHCAVRRALLYVPAVNEQKLSKSFNLVVDCIIMDCEGEIAENDKEKARNNIKKQLDIGPDPESTTEWSVRINPVQIPELCEADINTILSAKFLPNSICLPKVENVDQLQWFAEKVWSALMKRPEDSRGPIKLLMLIESAIAIINLPELCKKAMDLSSVAPIVPVALMIGFDNLLATIGGFRTMSGIELLYARQKTVLVAKAFGLQAIDLVFLNVSNNNAFLESCKDGAILGYTGKQVIHPNQVGLAQDVFSPSRSRVRWAKNIVKAFDENQKMGKDELILENKIIDMPTVRLAKNILEAAKRTGKAKELDM